MNTRCNRRSTHQAARGTRQDGARSMRGCHTEAHQATARLHDGGLRQAGRCRAAREALEIGEEHGREVGVKGRGGNALVLPDLGEHLR